MKIKIIVPFPLDEAGVKNREAGIPEKQIHSQFTVKFVPVKNSCSWMDSYYDDLIADLCILEEGLKAEEEGYDGVGIDTMSDSGLYALRSRLKIPVVAPSVVTMHLAGMLGHKFSVITLWERWVHLYEKTVKEYKLTEKCASLRHIGEVPNLSQLLTGKEERISKKLEAEALKAINEDGADVIILGSTTMHQSSKYLSENLPVPVLNPGVVSYKICEMLVELGLSHSKKAFPSPTDPKDEMLMKMLASVSAKK